MRGRLIRLVYILRQNEKAELKARPSISVGEIALLLVVMLVIIIGGFDETINAATIKPLAFELHSEDLSFLG